MARWLRSLWLLSSYWELLLLLHHLFGYLLLHGGVRLLLCPCHLQHRVVLLIRLMLLILLHLLLARLLLKLLLLLWYYAEARSFKSTPLRGWELWILSVACGRWHALVPLMKLRIGSVKELGTWGSWLGPIDWHETHAVRYLKGMACWYNQLLLLITCWSFVIGLMRLDLSLRRVKWLTEMIATLLMEHHLLLLIVEIVVWVLLVSNKVLLFLTWLLITMIR